MSSSPESPVFLVDGNDVMAFRSVSAAESFLEPWAVSEERAEGFDSIGRRLAFSVERREQSRLVERLLGPDEGPVHIALAEHTPADPTILAKQLAQFLRAVASDPRVSYETMSLSELVKSMDPFIGES